jgi:hypothetical protein
MHQRQMQGHPGGSVQMVRIVGAPQPGENANVTPAENAAIHVTMTRQK